MLRTALSLARKNLAVFPCRPRDKRPATPNGLKDATKDPDMIRHWWGLEPQYNVAIATGAVSGIFAVDIDGLDAELELRRLEAEHGKLPGTAETITARGRHLYFKMPEISVRNTTGKIAPGIDTRANGGYILAPPSVHPTGRVYAWSVDCANEIAPAPDWLLKKITARMSGDGKATPPSEWRALVGSSIAEGQRDCTLTKLAGYLLRRYVDPVVVLELVQAVNATRCTPPLPQDDLERIVASICGIELRRRGNA
jgi:hypothetical protein